LVWQAQQMEFRLVLPERLPVVTAGQLVLERARQEMSARRLALAALPVWLVVVERLVLPEPLVGGRVVAPAEKAEPVPGFSACCRCQNFRLSFRRTVFQKNCHSWLEQSHKFFEAGFTGEQ
jgi:hypothetical protein